MVGGVRHIEPSLIQFGASSSSHSSLPPPPTSLNLPVSVNNSGSKKQSSSASCSYCRCGTCTRTECINRKGGKSPIGILTNAIFRSVPSEFEVLNAISALQNFMLALSSSGSDNREQQLLDFGKIRTLISQYGRVCDAFRLLQTDPSVKRLVISLSTDPALWDAVMNNEMVRKLLEPSHCLTDTGENCRSPSSREEQDLVIRLLSWIIDLAIVKVTDLIQKFQSLMNEVFQSRGSEIPAGEAREELENKVRSSFILTIVILLIVVVTRAQEG